MTHTMNYVSGTIPNISLPYGNLTTPGPPPAPPASSGPSMTHRLLIDSVIGLPLGVFGILGNLLALLVLSRQKPRVTTTVVLMVLSVMDNFVLLGGVMLRSILYIALYTHTMEGYRSIYAQLFLILYPCIYVFRLLDMWLTVLLTVDRYIVVCRPLHASTICTTRRAIRDIVIISFSSVLFSIPRFFEHESTNANSHGFGSTALLKSRVYTITYRIAAFFLLQYVVPLALMLVLNALLLKSLRRATAERAVYQKQSITCSSSNSSSQATHSVTMIVIVIVLICALTNSLALVTHLLWSMENCWPKAMGFLNPYRRYAALYSNLTISINSASNLPIYYLCSERFKQLVKDTLMCKRRSRLARMDSHGRETVTLHVTHSQDRTTTSPATRSPAANSNKTTFRFNTNYMAVKSDNKAVVNDR